ncbi:hypothetical protein VTN00DRAFT_7606 [Thermoascus crustaceus]|uniref:uncharacterized protein n=1 Tax=Thermoascus crustaceus TaxID=5088 RepID=UPI0037442BCC
MQGAALAHRNRGKQYLVRLRAFRLQRITRQGRDVGKVDPCAHRRPLASWPLSDSTGGIRDGSLGTPGGMDPVPVTWPAEGAVTGCIGMQ